MAVFWTQFSGQTLQTLTEGITTTVDLPLDLSIVSEDSSLYTVTHISGDLPLGMVLQDNSITGTPREVVRDTEYKFVLRASYNNQISDRTYVIKVVGPDTPTWKTAEGLLPVGQNDMFFILDNTPIDFQLIAEDSDQVAGQVLEYFIGSGDGELPPGITLTADGKLVGIVDPILALEKRLDTGNYDGIQYDNIGYDFGLRSNNGFDSFFYDTTIYDLSVPTRSPRKLNRNYEFIVSVNDGDTIARRKFKIFVVGDDFVRSDNTIMQVDTGVFTADNTHIRVPLWLTPRNFGYRRANNYVTLFLDVLDTNELLGVITYVLQEVNDDGSTSVIPEGLYLDSTTGEIAGRVPYQPNVTKEYKFTVKASRFGPATNKQYVNLAIYEDIAVGANTLKVTKNQDVSLLVGRIIEIDERSFTITKVDTTESEDYDVIYLGQNITVKVFENALPNQTEIKINKIGNPYLTNIIGKQLTFGDFNYIVASVDPNEKVYRCKMNHTSSIFASDFNKVRWEEVVGASTTGVTSWNSEAEYIVDQQVKYNATNFEKINVTTNISTTVYAGATTPIELIPLYTTRIVKQGEPFEFNLYTTLDSERAESNKTFTVSTLGDIDSTITWITPATFTSISANYISNLSVVASSNLPNAKLIYALSNGKLPPGLTLLLDGSISGKITTFGSNALTQFDTGKFILDGNTLTIDRKFTFEVSVQDQFKYSVIKKEFNITIGDPDNKTYSNIFARPMLKQTQRTLFNTFISNTEVFNPNYIYRPNDPNFGIQEKINMLVYSGIETKTIDHYVAAIAKNHKRKNFKLGSIKTAVAKLPGTQDIVYEVVYLEVLDPYLPAKGDVRKHIKIDNKAKILASEAQFGDKPAPFISFSLQSRTLGDSTAGIVDVIPGQGNISVLQRSGIEVISGSNNELLLGLRDLSTVTFPATISSYVADETATSPWYLESVNTNTIKVDSNAISSDQRNDTKKYITNIKNMRDNIAESGTTVRNFLPLWMRTAQEGQLQELGYVAAIPLCYTVAGKSKIIKNAIDFQNFNFTQLDFDIDRYIIDNTTGNTNEQYLLFANYQFNI